MMRKLTREKWLKEMPELIYKLKKDYNFYYNRHYNFITKDIIELTNKSKLTHRIVLYTKDQRFFLVVYSKKGPSIYYTDDYVTSKWPVIRYFIRKFVKFYDKADKDRFEEEFAKYATE